MQLGLHANNDYLGPEYELAVVLLIGTHVAHKGLSACLHDKPATPELADQSVVAVHAHTSTKKAAQLLTGRSPPGAAAWAVCLASAWLAAPAAAEPSALGGNPRS